MQDMKHCRKCNRDYPATTEYFHRAGMGLRSTCKDCTTSGNRARYASHPELHRGRATAWKRKHPDRTNATNRQYRAAHPEWTAAVARRSKLRKQGWTVAEVEAALERQSGLCAIEGCDRTATDADHCHATGVQRKLLCSNCNKALGLILDSPDRARGMAAYLEAYRGEGTGL